MSLKYICFLLVLVFVEGTIAAPETNNWSSRVGLGLNISHATSDTTQFNGDFALSHKTAQHEFFNTLNAVYGKTDDSISENNVNALLQWNQILAADSYLYANSTYRYDDVANIDYRLMAGVGAGYYFVQNDELIIAVEFGPSYLTERLRTPNDLDELDAGYHGESNQGYMWRFAQRYQQTIGDASKIWESIEYLLELSDTSRYFVNGTVGMDVPVNSCCDLRFSVVNKYDSNPAPDTDSSDLSMRVSLVYRLL